ncbi:MAG: ankyrin repeat domain-containing protein [Candidatus Chromulinivorax sp.]
MKLQRILFGILSLLCLRVLIMGSNFFDVLDTEMMNVDNDDKNVEIHDFRSNDANLEQQDLKNNEFSSLYFNTGQLYDYDQLQNFIKSQQLYNFLYNVQTYGKLFGYDINFPVESGTSLLSQLIYFKKFDLAQKAIELGADVNKADDFGITPLHVAILQKNIPMIESLIQAGAHLDIIDGNRRTIEQFMQAHKVPLEIRSLIIKAKQA